MRALIFFLSSKSSVLVNCKEKFGYKVWFVTNRMHQWFVTQSAECHSRGALKTRAETGRQNDECPESCCLSAALLVYKHASGAKIESSLPIPSPHSPESAKRRTKRRKVFPILQHKASGVLVHVTPLSLYVNLKNDNPEFTH